MLAMRERMMQNDPEEEEDCHWLPQPDLQGEGEDGEPEPGGRSCILLFGRVSRVCSYAMIIFWRVNACLYLSLSHLLFLSRTCIKPRG